MTSKAPAVGRKDLTTSKDIMSWKQRMKKENNLIAPQVTSALHEVGDNLYKQNSYFGYFRVDQQQKNMAAGEEALDGPSSPLACASVKKSGSEAPKPGQFTLDKLSDDGSFDPRSKVDTWNPSYKRLQKGLSTTRPILASQNYGWYRPIDMPKYGFEVSSFVQKFYDPFHLNVSDKPVYGSAEN